MPLHVLIVPDKFKGTLSSIAASHAIARGWLKARPLDSVELLPMSDGGDGFGEVLGNLIGAKARRATVLNAAHKPVVAKWWWQEKTKTAVIESARVIGLTMLPAGKYHPFELDTFGLGLLLKKISKNKPSQCIIGIGGSATNDGGFGMVRASGWRFYGLDGKEICRWTELTQLERIQPPANKMSLGKIIVAMDVKNLLLGRKGASRVYGPQKGLTQKDIPRAEEALGRLAKVAKKTFRKDYSKVPGSGAAGGLGFALMAFLNATPEAGFEIFAEFANLEERLKKVDLVITGEGAIDRSTIMGKGVGEVARMCLERKKMCIALAGRISSGKKSLRKYFILTDSILGHTSVEEAMSRPAYWLAKIAEVAGKNFSKLID